MLLGDRRELILDTLLGFIVDATVQSNLLLRQRMQLDYDLFLHPEVLLNYARLFLL